MWQLLDILLAVFHLGLTVFNITGWIWKRTRKLHLITIMATLTSWVLLGAWFGWGYCPFTDWQWQIKEKLGERNLPNSFIKYYADKISGLEFDPAFVDNATLGVLIALVLITIYINFLRKKPVLEK
jgi:hypothetical protein